MGREAGCGRWLGCEVGVRPARLQAGRRWLSMGIHRSATTDTQLANDLANELGASVSAI